MSDNLLLRRRRGNRREAAIRCNNPWRTDGIRLRGVENVPMEWQRYFRLRTESEIWCDDSRFWEAKLLIFRKKWVKMPVPNPKTEILCYKKNLMASHRNYPPATPNRQGKWILVSQSARYRKTLVSPALRGRLSRRTEFILRLLD